MLNDKKEVNEKFCSCLGGVALATRVGHEVVDGKLKMKPVGKAVSIFGGAKVKEGSFAYEESYKISKFLAEKGISVISGGGPGVMEASNKGAKEVQHEHAKAIGLNINIAAEKNDKRYQDISIDFEHFASRKIIFCAHSDAFVVMPGGFGTLDELFEVLTLIQTHKTEVVPIILVGKYFWQDMLTWIQNTMLKEGILSQAHFELLTLVDNSDEAIEYLQKIKFI